MLQSSLTRDTTGSVKSHRRSIAVPTAYWWCSTWTIASPLTICSAAGWKTFTSTPPALSASYSSATSLTPHKTALSHSKTPRYSITDYTYSRLVLLILRVQAYAEQMDIPYVETSAKTNANVETTFMKLVESMLKSEQADDGWAIINLFIVLYLSKIIYFCCPKRRFWTLNFVEYKQLWLIVLSDCVHTWDVATCGQILHQNLVWCVWQIARRSRATLEILQQMTNTTQWASLRSSLKPC